MKTIQGRFLILLGIVALFTLLWFMRGSIAQSKKQESPPVLRSVQNVSALVKRPLQTNSSKTPRNLLNVKRAADLTGGEKAELAKKFKEEFGPAVEKWLKAYEGRVPFNLEDLTLDEFTERLGRDSSFFLYTFVFNDITFTIQDSNGKATVFYMMTRQAAKDLNQLQGRGSAPDLTVPINREDVIRMVKADSGVEFKPSEVLIKPTAAACALNGGAFVDLLPAGVDPNNGLSSKIDLVFGPDGKLVTYERDPFF